jgi:acyl-CoA dehydrogenase
VPATRRCRHGALVRHGSEARSGGICREIAAGRLRLQSFAVTEPTTGTDTTKTRTMAVRRGERYVVNGQKVWISRVQHSDLMLLLARTTPLAEVTKKTQGLSIFIVDLRDAAQRVTSGRFATVIREEFFGT